MQYYTQIITKLIATVILLMIYVKISGKSQLAPMTPFDQIGNMVVGAIGGTTLLNTDISASNSAVFLSAWITILLLIRYLKSKNLKLKELIDGKRHQLIENGKILTDNFKKAKLNISNMEILMHKEGITGINQLKNVWLEPNGQLTIDKKGAENMSILLIEEGQINKTNLEEIHKDETWLTIQLHEKSIQNIKDVFCAEWFDQKLWIYPYQKTDKK